MSPHLQDAINYIVRQRPFSKDILHSYKTFLQLMEDIPVTVPEVWEKESLRRLKKDEGFPLFSREDLPVDFGGATRALSRIMEHLCQDKKTQETEALQACLKKIDENKDWAKPVFSAILNKDHAAINKKAKEVGLQTERLYFLAKLSLKPSLDAIRSACSSNLDKQAWDYGYCPICGSEPNMAYLDKKGKRHLHCELCGEEWTYPRLNCPFCKNEDQQALGYFHSEGEQGLRVYFCRKCKRYIKTVDRREFELETPMDLEYLATLHLDILAEKEGFE